MNRIHCIISGDVIGVGFRSWVRRFARDNHLNGWVKNREDKTVEFVAEGEKKALEAFVAACNKGPDIAWVERVNTTWLPATGEFIDFSVLY